MAIIDVDDLADYMNLSIEGGQATAASIIIDGLEADLEAYVRRPLVRTEVEDETVKVDAAGRVRFRHTPVREVTSFSVDGVAVTADSWTAETWGLSGLSFVHLSSPLQTDPVLLASYVAGLPGEDLDDPFTRKARATLLRAASRDFNQVIRQDAAGIARLGIEGTSMDFHGGVKAGAGGLTENELEGFKRWRRRVFR